MRYALAILIAGFALIEASCATGVSYAAVQSSLGQIPDGHGRVYVYRLEGEGKRVSTAVRASGLPIGRAVPGKFFVADLTAGTHLLTAARSTQRSLALRVYEGETYFVRAEARITASNYHWDLVLVPEKIAKSEIAGLTSAGK
jgi:hypothetical protein